MKTGKEIYLTDLISYLCTESFAIQMRGLARGSDGLAEVSEEDIKTVLIPKLTKEERNRLEDLKNNLIEGTPSPRTKIDSLIRNGELKIEDAEKRTSHVILVWRVVTRKTSTYEL